MLRILCFLLLPQLLSAQSDWIDAGRIQAQIGGTGLRSLRMPAANTLAPPLQGIRHLGLWIGGLDPAGNLKLAVDTAPDTIGDFSSGFRGIPGSDRIWKVTAEDILAHRNDWATDGDIDDTIPAIFAWPAYGNPYSMEYNGFEADFQGPNAPYNDGDVDQQYDPGRGDYPAISRREGPIVSTPDAMIFMPFYTREDIAGSQSFLVNCSLTAFTFACEGADFMKENIFLLYHFRYAGGEPLDSVFLGVFLDADIGEPDSDYFGADIQEGLSSVYFYNADTLSDATFGIQPPVISANVFDYPADYFGPGQNAPLRHVMPVHFTGAALPAGMMPPIYDVEYYRNLTGSWRDGTPLRIGGQGYFPLLFNQPAAEIAFPDLPSMSGGWSEMQAGNPPGNRQALFSFGPMKMLPDLGNAVLFSIAYQRDTTLSATLHKMQDNRIWQGRSITTSLPAFEDWADSLCLGYWTGTQQPIGQTVILYPNPASEVIHWDIPENTSFLRAFVLNTAGQTVLRRAQPGLDHLDIAGLDNGVYFLRLETADGRALQGRFVVLR